MKLFLFVVIFFLSALANGQRLEINVDPNGDDKNDGSLEMPKKTLEAALKSLEHLEADSFRVILHAGEYRITKGLELNNIKNVTIEGVNVDEVILSGSVFLDDYTKLNKSHALYRKNPKISKEIVEIDLSNIDELNHKKMCLAGFRGSNPVENYILHELKCNNQSMNLSRWPNNGYVNFNDFIEKDDKIGIKFTDQRMKGWVNEPNMLLHGYWYWLWADAYEQVDYVDAEKNTIWLNPPYNHYNFRKDKPFAVINAISEIDQPGEYAYDYEAKKLYFYPTTDVKKSRLELTICETALITINNSSNVEIKNITIRQGANNGVEIHQSQNVLIDNCEINSFARDGVIVKDCQNFTASNCEVYDNGRGAMRLVAENYTTLEKTNYLVEKCHIHNLSRIDKTYTPAVHISAVGARVANCKFHDIPSSAIRLDGNDNLIEYNEIFNCVTESDDQGAVDMWGTQNYRGNVIRYNYFADIGPQSNDAIDAEHGRAGIRLDDAISGVFMYGNVFNNSNKGRFGAIQIHGGKDNIVWNNLFYDCEIAVSFSAWSESFWKRYTKKAKEFFEDNRELYIQKYPELIRYDANINKQLVTDNVFYNCKKEDRDRGDNYERVTWERNLNLQNLPALKMTSESLKNLVINLDESKFILIPFEKIGLK